MFEDPSIPLLKLVLECFEPLFDQLWNLSEWNGATEVNPAGGPLTFGLVLSFHGRSLQTPRWSGQDGRRRGVPNQPDHPTKTDPGLIHAGDTFNLVGQHARGNGGDPVIHFHMAPREVLKDMTQNGEPRRMRGRKTGLVGPIRTDTAMVEFT
jgi:hypothetical protein